MSVLIKDMEMPEHCGYCRFRYDGICHALQKTQYATTDCPLVSVPVQPEIIRCKDCKWCVEHYDTDENATYWVCKNWDGGTDADGYCHEAERKE